MTDLPAYDVGYIKKVRESGFGRGVPVGYVASFLKSNTPPEGWEWWEPPPEMQARPIPEAEAIQPSHFDGEGRLIFQCFDDRRAGEECPLVPQCEETNRCLVQMLIELGWRVQAPPD